MPSIIPITMPKWGLSMEEGTITHWYSSEGDMVVKGEDLVDIETSKISNVFEASSDGILRKVVAELDVAYPCGALLAVIANDEVTDDEIDTFIASHSADVISDDESGVPELVSEFAKVNDVDIHYLMSGAGEQAVVFLHGFGGDLDNWQFVQPLVAQGKLTIALDLPGHGQSTKNISKFESIESIADLVADFLHAQSFSKAHVVGHSMGGTIALVLAKRHAHLVDRLTLLAPASGSNVVNADYIHGFINARSRRELEQVVQILFGDSDLVQRAMLDDLMKYKRIDGVPDALKRFAEILLSEATGAYLDDLGSLSQSITVLRGDLDKVVKPSMPNDVVVSRSETLKGVGHMPHMEAVSEVVSAILD